MTAARLAGRRPGFHGPRGYSFCVAAVALRWSECVWQGGNPDPGGGDALGQLGDVGFLDPAPRMPAAPVRAGVTGPALAYLAALIDGDLPGLLRGEPDRGALAGAEVPADGVGQLIAAAGGQLI